jgi:hypothetical protein
MHTSHTCTSQEVEANVIRGNSTEVMRREEETAGQEVFT